MDTSASDLGQAATFDEVEQRIRNDFNVRPFADQAPPMVLDVRGQRRFPDATRALLKDWAIARGINPIWATQAKDYQLESAFKSFAYYQKIKALREDEIVPAKGSGRRGKSYTHYGDLNDLAPSPAPARQAPNLFQPPPASSDGSASLPPTALSPEAIARAAAAVIGPRLDAAKRELTAAAEAAARAAAATEIERLGLSDKVKQQIRDLGTQAALDVLAANLPTRIELTAPTLAQPLDLGLQHERFPFLLRLMGARGRGGYRLNIWLTGPTGSGKTTAVETAANALASTGAFERYRRDANGHWYITSDADPDQPQDLNGLIYDSPFGGDSSLDADYKVIGYDKADGTFRWTTFLRIFCFGGVYIADEIDNWSPSALVALNAPLANGWVATPAGIMRRHPDSCIIAAANTWGLGATSDYVGRSRLDQATVNRFPNKIDWPYDERLETAVAEADAGLLGRAWATIVQQARAAAKRQGLQVIFSPRNTYDGIAALRAGFDVKDVVAMNLIAGLDVEYVGLLGLDKITTLPGLSHQASAADVASTAAHQSSTNDQANSLAKIAYRQFYEALNSPTNGGFKDPTKAIKIFREFHGPDNVSFSEAVRWVEDFNNGHIPATPAAFAAGLGARP